MNFSHLGSAAMSDVGRKRKGNEDAILTIPEKGMFCVADGMGGAACGEVASGWAVEELEKAFKRQTGKTPKSDVIRSALNAASARIKAMSDDRGVSGTGTTAVVLFFDDRHPDKAAILHAGDSRAYRYRKGKLSCLTIDHSMAAAAGVKHERMLPSMFRGVITRAVGLEETVELEETPVSVEGGDLYLLCSDGLSRMLSDKRMQKLLHKAGDVDVCVLVRQLIEAANSAGGEDNISVVIVRASDPLPSAPELEHESSESTDLPGLPGESGTSETALSIPPGEEKSTGGDSASRISDTSESLVGMTPDTGHSLGGESDEDDGESETIPDSSLLEETATLPREMPAEELQEEEPATLMREPDGQDEQETPETPHEPVVQSGTDAGRLMQKRVGIAVAAIVAVVVALLVVTRKPPREPDSVPPVTGVEEAIAVPEGPDVATSDADVETPPVPDRVEPAAAPVPEKPVSEEAAEPVAPPQPVGGIPAVATEDVTVVEDETMETGSEPQGAGPEPEPAERPVAVILPSENGATVVVEQPAPVETRPATAVGQPTARKPEVVADKAARETVADVVSMLEAAIPLAQEGGEWDEVGKILDSAQSLLDQIAVRVEGFENAKVWIEEWRKADGDVSYGNQVLQKHALTVSMLLTSMGIDQNAEETPAQLLSGENRIADAYCRELFKLRQLLVKEMTLFLSSLRQETAALGKDPHRAVAGLSQFAGIPRDDILAAFDQLQHSMMLLDSWLTQDREKKVPLMEIMKGPTDIIPRLAVLREEMWSGIMKSLSASASAHATWQRRTGNPKVLNEIADLRGAILNRHKASRRKDANLRWPLRQDLANIERALVKISQVVRDFSQEEG